MKFEKNSVIKTLKDLIKIKSVNPPGTDSEIVDYIEDFLAEFGISSNIIEAKTQDLKMFNLIAHIGPKGKTLVFNGHHDVVPADEGWTHDPFNPVIKGDFLYGRGSCDMKGGLVSMMYAMAALSKQESNLTGRVTLAVVADEERDASLGTIYLLKKGLIKGDWAIVGESTAPDIVVARKGVHWAKLVAMGKAQHASRPEKGVNAILKMVDVIKELSSMKFPVEKHQTLGLPTISVDLIKGGTKINTVPDKCSIEVDIRILPAQTKDDIDRAINEVIKKFDKVEYQCIAHIPSYEIDKNSELVKTISANVQTIMGRKSNFVYRTGSSDVVFFGKAGFDAVDFGPEGEWAHCAGEYVIIPSVISTAKVYLQTAIDLLTK